MKKFLSRLLLFLSPVLIHLIVYIATDPFMILRRYDNYYTENRFHLALDRDYVSTTTYAQQQNRYHYDSFIFGNSRSIFYEIQDWQRHIGQECRCYHFDAASESLYGVWKKIKYIDQNNGHIQNALLIMDHSLLKQHQPNTDSHLFYPAPALENNRNIIGFHLTHWKAFANLKLLYAFTDYALSKKSKPYMSSNFLLDFFNGSYDVTTNEIQETDLEAKIAEGCYYTSEKMNIFKGKQTPKIHPAVIEEAQRGMLEEIKSIFDKHQTDYKIVISPLYSQIRLHGDDLAILEHIFDPKHVADFSGVNEITTDYRNYYEDSHYRPHVSRYIMSKIYAQQH